MTNNVHKEIVKRMKCHDDHDAVKFHALNGDHNDHMKLYYATMFEFYKECVYATFNLLSFSIISRLSFKISHLFSYYIMKMLLNIFVQMIMDL